MLTPLHFFNLISVFCFVFLIRIILRILSLNVLKIYGAEGAKDQAIDMLMAQNMEITETNLYSALTNLEMDLEFQTAASMSDEEE